MKRAGQDSHCIKQRPNDPKAPHRVGEGAGRVIGVELSHSQGLRDTSQPPIGVEPAMEMENVHENEDKRNVSGDSLPGVATIAGEAVLAQIGVASTGNPHTRDRMENNREENEGPFDHRQKRERMDRENSILEYIHPARQTRVGEQMDAHVSPDRNQATQGVKPTDEKFMPLEKSATRCRVAR